MYKCGVRLSEEIQKERLLLMERKENIRHIELELYISGWGTVGVGKIKRNRVYKYININI